MDKWTESGQVAVIILDSIERNITEVYQGGERQQLEASCRELLLPDIVSRPQRGQWRTEQEQLGLSVCSDTHPMRKHFPGPI